MPMPTGQTHGGASGHPRGLKEAAAAVLCQGEGAAGAGGEKRAQEGGRPGVRAQLYKLLATRQDAGRPLAPPAYRKALAARHNGAGAARRQGRGQRRSLRRTEEAWDSPARTRAAEREQPPALPAAP